MTNRAIRTWFVKFCSGDTTLKHELRVGRPFDFDNDLLKAILEQNLHQLTSGIAERLNILTSIACHKLEKSGKFSKLST
ncbi:Histone-lysine N-methyltransferase SETMAR, partial [Stegodyphus mimosarum]